MTAQSKAESQKSYEEWRYERLKLHVSEYMSDPNSTCENFLSDLRKAVHEHRLYHSVRFEVYGELWNSLK